MAETFYVDARYLGEVEPSDGGSAWCLPLDQNLAHLKETANVEELMANPEDFTLFPEEVQAGCEQWALETTSTLYWEPGVHTPLFYWATEFEGPDFYFYWMHEEVEGS